MFDANETAFLRSIAEQNADDSARMVFADWLEERGESDRADFVRTQCELASAAITDERRYSLRVRERALLDAHRQEWCQAFGLPIEDVSFERGLISKMRLSRWDHGKLLNPAQAARFMTLTELDLSGLNLNDADLQTFAQSARFPALRKLILSNNHLTNAGVTALASAAGLPSLECVYLFGNSLTDDARVVLETSPHFLCTQLDLGDRADGYCLSPGEAELARREYLRTHLLPFVSQYFKKYDLLQSAMLCVAQYWADEADDAVHGELIVSELPVPTLEGVSHGDSGSDPNLTTTRIERQYGDPASSALSVWGAHWDDNSGAIPLWAAFAPENGSQEFGEFSEAYLPAVLFYRNGGYEILPMTRPNLDGVRPEWGWDD